MNVSSDKTTGWKQKVVHELIEYWTIVLYLTLFFSVFTNYRRLLLAEYDISYQHYWISLIKALVMGKVILVAENVGVGRRFEDKPLIIPTLYKVFLFTVCLAFFDALESMIRSFIHGFSLRVAAHALINQYNDQWFAGALMVFFALIPFFAVGELTQIFGEGTIFKLFFRTRSATEPILHQKGNTVQDGDEPGEK